MAQLLRVPTPLQNLYQAVLHLRVHCTCGCKAIITSIVQINVLFSIFQIFVLLNDQETMQPAIRSAELAQVLYKVFSDWVSERILCSNQQDDPKRTTNTTRKTRVDKGSIKRVRQTAGWQSSTNSSPAQDSKRRFNRNFSSQTSIPDL